MESALMEGHIALSFERRSNISKKKTLPLTGRGQWWTRQLPFIGPLPASTSLPTTTSLMAYSLTPLLVTGCAVLLAAFASRLWNMGKRQKDLPPGQSFLVHVSNCLLYPLSFRDQVLQRWPSLEIFPFFPGLSLISSLRRGAKTMGRFTRSRSSTIPSSSFPVLVPSTA